MRNKFTPLPEPRPYKSALASSDGLALTLLIRLSEPKCLYDETLAWLGGWPAPGRTNILFLRQVLQGNIWKSWPAWGSSGKRVTLLTGTGRDKFSPYERGPRLTNVPKIPPVFLAPWLLLAYSEVHQQQQKQEIQLSSAGTRQSPICRKGDYFYNISLWEQRLNSLSYLYSFANKKGKEELRVDGLTLCMANNSGEPTGGADPPPLFLDQTEARRAEKFLEDHHPRLSKGLDEPQLCPLIQNNQPY